MRAFPPSNSANTANCPVLRGQSGLTLIEITAAILICGIMAAIAVGAMSRFGSRNKVRQEAEKVVDRLWEVRSQATTGMKNPCMDFPAADSVRMYSDTSTIPDGFGGGDRVLGGFRYQGGVRAISISGGAGLTHAVCFRSRGIVGSSGGALDITLARRLNDPDTRRVRLLPSTGIAKVK